jgi:hypothetical protein
MIWNPEIYCVNKIQWSLALQQVATIYRVEQKPLNSRGNILNVESQVTIAPPCIVNMVFYIQDQICVGEAGKAVTSDE